MLWFDSWEGRYFSPVKRADLPCDTHSLLFDWDRYLLSRGLNGWSVKLTNYFPLLLNL
jgi:hypothetical protein